MAVKPSIRTAAALKAAETKRRRKAKALALRKRAAAQAWVTMRSAPYKARRTSMRSQVALSEWAKATGWYVLFLDAPSGHPRTGIVDAILLRISSKHPDDLDLRLVQLKGGSGALAPAEVIRLAKAAKGIRVGGLCAFHDGKELRFQSDWMG